MARSRGFNLAAVAAAAQPGVMEIAEAIAQDARDGYQMHELKFVFTFSDSGKTDKKWGIHVEPTKDGGARVVTYFPLAHIDEYGGSRVYSRPSGAMRSAAAKHGRFKPE